MKNNKGITLVALTITIIVLLIIASISITGIVLDMNSVNENISKSVSKDQNIQFTYYANVDK